MRFLGHQCRKWASNSKLSIDGSSIPLFTDVLSLSFGTMQRLHKCYKECTVHFWREGTKNCCFAKLTNPKNAAFAIASLYAKWSTESTLPLYLHNKHTNKCIDTKLIQILINKNFAGIAPYVIKRNKYKTNHNSSKHCSSKWPMGFASNIPWLFPDLFD